MPGSIRTLTAVAITLLFAAITSAQQPREDSPKPPPAEKPFLERIAGTWLFDEVLNGKNSQIGVVWSSKLTISGDSFTLSNFYRSGKDLTGSVAMNKDNPKAVDLKIREFNHKANGLVLEIPAGTLQAICSLEDSRLVLCFPRKFGGMRPVSFENKLSEYKVTLVKAPMGFKEFPKEINVTVLGPDAKPAARVNVASFLATTNDRTAYNKESKTGSDGVAKVKYEDCVSGLIARDGDNKRIALIQASPLKLWTGELSATLVPECHVTGKIVSEDLAKLGRPVKWTNVYLYHGGDTIMLCSSEHGTFEFFLPSGTYKLLAHGSNVESKTVTITVPPGRSEYGLDPVVIPATALALLEGRDAPDLAGVVAWKGKPVKLSELKGNYVLLEFWGYWCGPCIKSMPALIELHEKYGEKGVKVLGVHMDSEGEVDSAAKLDEKVERYKHELWKKDIPFPIALVSGKRQGEERPGGTIAQYGIQAFPTCILIDREGKVVGQFEARDIKRASEEIDKLLRKK